MLIVVEIIYSIQKPFGNGVVIKWRPRIWRYRANRS